MGPSNKSKSTVKVTTPEPSADETLARQKASALQDYSASASGLELRYDPEGTPYYEKRALTPDEQQQADRDKQINDLIYSKLTGKISPEDQALVDQAYGSALESGKSDLNAEFQRTLDQLKIGEGRGYEDIKTTLDRGTADINRSATQAAAARGLNMTDTPILGERQRLFQAFGEDVNKSATRLTQDVGQNKQILGEDFLRNLRNFEVGLQGAKAGATLDVGQRQQLFASQLKQFQDTLQQQAMVNRQMIGQGFSNIASDLGNLRSRNVTQVSTGMGSTGAGASSIMGGAGGLIGGIGSLFSSSAGGTSAASNIGGGISSWFSSREFKDNIKDVDLDKILTELEAMGVYTWNYKPVFNDSRSHIGPVIEESPGSIVEGSQLVIHDCVGFLFATVKALNEKVKKLEAKQGEK